MVAHAAVARDTGGQIHVGEVQRTYITPTGEQVHALDRVSLTVRPGEFVSLVGPSGCGKSTLLRLVAGLDHPDGGSLTLDSERISAPHYERGLVFQDPTLFPWLTVAQNVAFGLESRGILKAKRGEVEEFVHLVGLGGFENSFPHNLSGGMAQRVALARALVNHPKVLLLDEPLGALDAFTRMQMQDEILRIWGERGNTMVLVTHDVDEAIYMSDRIVIMSPRPGRIQQILDVPLGRPRARNHPDFFLVRSKILELLHLAGEIEEPNYL